MFHKIKNDRSFVKQSKIKIGKCFIKIFIL